MALIAHFDADAFFASVEQAADRRLRGRPVAVGGGRRGVVCSASYEARAQGVCGAMPSREALARCPELILVRGQFELYEQFSEGMFGMGEDLTPELERMSIDEGYLDLRGRTEDAAEGIRLMRGFVREIGGWLKIGVSCGLSARKRVAQIAGKAHKPRGFTVVPAGNEGAFLASLPLRALPGIGAVVEGRLRAVGLRRVGDLVQAGPDVVGPILGGRTAGLLALARGEDAGEVLREAPPAQSYGGQRSFAEPCGCEETVEAVLRELLGEQLERLRAAGKRARILAVGIRYSDYEEARASVALEEPSNVDPVFAGQLRGLLKRAWRRRVCVNQVRVQLERLYADWVQEDLFSGEADARMRALYAVKDELRGRFGAKALQPASGLGRGQ